MANYLQKLIFRSGILYIIYVTIADADIGCQKFLHTLFDKCLDYMLLKLEQKIVRSEPYILFFLFDKLMINNF